jgi:energy-coupling factor transporter ATP-binding protein EcfA2
VRRLVGASVEDFEKLFVNGVGAPADLEEAAYPPGCAPGSGPLHFRPLEAGGVLLEVCRARLESDDFRLAALFAGGRCVFTSPADLEGFFNGAVARAFGIAVEQPPAPPPERELPAAQASGTLFDELRPTARRPRREPRRPAPARKAVRSSQSPAPEALEFALGGVVRGQPAAVGRIAAVVSAQLAKTVPQRPESLLLIGPSGCGKTSAVEALPGVLAGLGVTGTHVFRVDCNELTDDYEVRRFLGAAPGLVGYQKRPPLVAALSEPRCIVLLDELEKADESVHTVFLGLLDEGRVTAPDGTPVRAADAIVAMTTNLDAAGLAYELRDAPTHGRRREQICRDHLLGADWPPELVGRIGSYAVFEPLAADTLHEIAEDAVHALAREYGLELDTPPPVITDVVLDLADTDDIGARALLYATRELLARAFADAARSGLEGPAAIDPGPPPRVLSAARSPA